MTKDEAFSIFDRLRAQGSVVFCMGRLWGWTVAIRGNVMSATNDEIIVVSTDRQSGSMSLRLDLDDLLIRTADPHEIPMLHTEGERTGLASIMLSLPLRIRPADLKKRLLDAPPREVLFVLEMPRES